MLGKIKVNKRILLVSFSVRRYSSFVWITHIYKNNSSKTQNDKILHTYHTTIGRNIEAPTYIVKREIFSIRRVFQKQTHIRERLTRRRELAGPSSGQYPVGSRLLMGSFLYWASLVFMKSGFVGSASVLFCLHCFPWNSYPKL